MRQKIVHFTMTTLLVLIIVGVLTGVGVTISPSKTDGVLKDYRGINDQLIGVE